MASYYVIRSNEQHFSFRAIFGRIAGGNEFLIDLDKFSASDAISESYLHDKPDLKIRSNGPLGAWMRRGFAILGCGLYVMT